MKEYRQTVDSCNREVDSKSMQTPVAQDMIEVLLDPLERVGK